MVGKKVEVSLKKIYVAYAVVMVLFALIIIYSQSGKMPFGVIVIQIACMWISALLLAMPSWRYSIIGGVIIMLLVFILIGIIAEVAESPGLISAVLFATGIGAISASYFKYLTAE